jgi:hypothetical protein
MRLIRIFLQLCVVFAIVLLFSGHFHLQARYEQLRTDFDGHWHYAPKDVPDFAFGKVRIFEDEVPYQLTKPKPKRQNPEQYCFTIYYGWR